MRTMPLRAVATTVGSCLMAYVAVVGWADTSSAAPAGVAPAGRSVRVARSVAATPTPARHATVSVTITVSAHRGGAQEEPQNSLLAFQHALDENVGEVEADTWITADDVAVVEHDATLTAPRCSGPYLDQDITTLTSTQLQEMQCDGQPIPTEDQLLDLMTHSSNTVTGLRLESKTVPGASDDAVAAAAYRVGKGVVDAGLADRAIVQDFAWAGIAGFHRASPDLRVSALIDQPTTWAAQQARQLGAYDLSYNAAYSTPYFNEYLRSLGLVPTVWGIDAVPTDPGALSIAAQQATTAATHRAVSSGAQVVIVNSPELVTEAVSHPGVCTLAWHDVADRALNPTSKFTYSAYYHEAAALPTYEAALVRISESAHATETAQLAPENLGTHVTTLRLQRNRAVTVRVGIAQLNGIRVATNYRYAGVTVTIMGLYRRSCT
ncbi:glycerophosphodiester phosphodiesterase [uncultured Jatrophihabitans sp.]|uniref:glycerophosphodiester phosphodiesterase n=1 Tax=uncultured Jatrophihabitans sp. TaxID=1610747 RepID=UPI0035CC4CF3